MNTDLKKLLQRLRKNLTILQERKAKYAGETPLNLLNQIEDYKKAIELTKDTLIGDMTEQALDEALASLILEITPPSQQPDIKIAAPPQPRQLPSLSEFAARRSELMYFASKLAIEHLAIITGMPGVGKTTLAIMVADFWKMRISIRSEEYSEVGQEFTLSTRFSKTVNRIFWHTFSEGDSVETLIWRLAGFLAWNGQDDLWKMLQTTRQTGGNLPPTKVLFDYLLEMIKEQTYLFCLDAFQYVADDPLLDQFINRLIQIIKDESLYLIITSNRLTQFAQFLNFKPLTGFTLRDTTELLKLRKLSLPRDLINKLHIQTGGNPQFLVLAIEALHSAQNKDQLVANLVESDDIERFLLQKVDDNLSDSERAILSALAILAGQPGTRQALEAILDQGGLRRVIRALTDRYLLTVQEHDYGQEYNLQPVLSSFYYDMLSPSKQKLMHSRAAQYYETEEPNMLKASHHYQQCKDYQHAAQLITKPDTIRTLINQGQAKQLCDLLKKFSQNHLEPFLWAKVNLTLAQMYALLGDRRLARIHYQATISTLNTLPVTLEINDLKARACRWLAELYNQQGQYPPALEHIQGGLTALANRQTPETIHLLLISGLIYIRQTKYNLAEDNAQKSLQIAQEMHQVALMPRCYELLGRIARMKGDNKTSLYLLREALDLHQYTGSLIDKAIAHNQVATTSLQMGQWKEAKEQLENAQQIFEQVGDIYHQAVIHNNLGLLALKQGQLFEAQTLFYTGLSLIEQSGRSTYALAHFYNNLGAIFIRQKEIKAARKHLEDSLAYLTQSKSCDLLPEIHRQLAQVALISNDLPTAQTQAEQSLTLARQFLMRTEQGHTLRILGEIAIVKGELEQAETYLDDSIAMLAETCDLYGEALGQLALAKLAVAQDSSDSEFDALEACTVAFEWLGAKLDLVEARRLQEKIEI